MILEAGRKFAAALFAAAALAGCHGQPPAAPLTATDKLALDDYESIRAALAADDPRAAKKAAAKMVKDLTPADANVTTPPLLASATAVSDAVALDTMRQKFEKLSDLVVPMVRGVDTYYIMQSDLPNTVPWVQRTQEVDNPFFGKAMHSVGELAKQ